MSKPKETRVHLESMIETFAHVSSKLWMQVTKEVSWAYRLKKREAPVIPFVLGRGGAHLPSRGIWDEIRKEVNRRRRRLRQQTAVRIDTVRAQSRREYMRRYMLHARRKKLAKLKRPPTH